MPYHVGRSLRELARTEGCHASTVMRLVRKFENRRDDPLVDEALTWLGNDMISPDAAAHIPFTCGQPSAAVATFPTEHKESLKMTAHFRDEKTIVKEARRILRRLCETGAILAVGADLEKAVVLRDLPNGKTTRIAVMDRTIAQAFALKEWIRCKKPGRIAAYEITNVGRAALKRLLAEEDDMRAGFAEAQMPFGDQHRVWDERLAPDAGEAEPVRMRYNLAESPVALLARRQDKDGTPFLTADMVHAAERLREDFELSQMGPRVGQNWERFLTAGDRGGFSADNGIAEGPRSARDRVARAMTALGPGLSDIALRCCCYLEGMEQAEKRLGWSARSGKVVLRIALDQLRRHYEATGGRSPLIG